MKKKLIAISIGLLGIVIIGVILSWIYIKNHKTIENNDIRIGAILPMTGSAAPYGENAKKGIEMAKKELEQKYQIKIEIMYEDSQTDPQSAVNALNKLININNIKIIIGDINSAGVLAMAPIAEKNKIILLSPGASNPSISKAGDFIFRNWYSDDLEGKMAANFANKNLKWEKTAILYVNASYGVGLANTYRDKFIQNGGKIVAFEAYPQDANDMKEQIFRVIESKPDGLYLPGWPKEMSLALKQLKEQGAQFKILSSQGFDDPMIFNLAGSAAQGVIFPVPEEPNPDDPVVKNFQKNYLEKYSKKPGVCSASGYDALRILVSAIMEVGKDNINIQKYLSNLKNFPGADGNISFDENRELIKKFIFKKVDNNQFQTY